MNRCSHTHLDCTGRLIDGNHLQTDGQRADMRLCHRAQLKATRLGSWLYPGCIPGEQEELNVTSCACRQQETCDVH